MLINLRTKYSTTSYKDLCFKHAVQEVMRGEEVEAEIIQFAQKGEYVFTVDCALCAMVEAERDNRLENWYQKYRKDK